MVNTDKKTALTTKIIWALLVLFLVVTIVAQLVIYFYNPITTEVATYYKSSHSYVFKGVCVRDEKTVTYNGSGVISYTHEDGAKLAKNSVIAKIYKSQNDLAIQQQIDELNKQIEVLEDAQSLVGTDNSQLEAFSSQIYEKHSLLIQNIDKGDYQAAADMKSDLLNLYSKKQIVKGNETSYDDKIAQLNNQIAALKARISQTPVDMQISESGYFVNNADGYEVSLNYETMKELTADNINDIIKNPVQNVSSNIIGKIVDDYKWRFIGIIDANLTDVYEGGTVNVCIGSSTNPVPADVISVEKQEDGTNIAIFECNRFSSDYITGRVAQFRIVLNDYVGIRVPMEAVRFDEEGNRGVFVKSGVEIRFKKIEMISSEDDYLIASDTTERDGYLSLYDNIVVEGKDLYDGKIIL